jgi:hypothetical protein
MLKRRGRTTLHHIMSARQLLWIPVALLTLAPACVTDADNPGPVAKLGGDGCSLLGCGGNGGNIEGVYFSDLNFGGILNAQGVKYVGYSASMVDALFHVYRPLTVQADRLVSYDPGTNTTIDQEDLVGTVLTVQIGLDPYYIMIKEYHRDLAYWTNALANPDPLESYRFEYSTPAAPSTFTDLCDVFPAEPGDGWADHQLDALVFEGDRYNPDTFAVTNSAMVGPKTWFNIACYRSLPAKQKLVRRAVSAAHPPQYPMTSTAERTTFAHAWAADYCGDGSSFTITGEKLRIRDAEGWIPEAPPVGWADNGAGDAGPAVIEAVWGPTGAVCLDVPRLEVSEGTIDATIHTTITAWCTHVGHPLPPCTGQSWFPGAWTTQGRLLTANPFGS